LHTGDTVLSLSYGEAAKVANSTFKSLTLRKIGYTNDPLGAPHLLLRVIRVRGYKGANGETIGESSLEANHFNGA